MGEAAEEIGATFDDGVDEPVVESPEVAPVAPAEEAKTEEVAVEVPKESEDEQNAIREAAFKAREAKREAAETQRQLEEANRKLQQYEAPVRPGIPPPPDPYEDNFAEKVAYRDALIASAAKYDAQQGYVEQQRQAAEQQKWQKQQDKLRETVTTYSGTADKLGISAQELQQAGNAVAQFGVHDDLAQHILTDDQGPSITLYLAKNPMELAKISDMTPTRAAAYIESTIKPNAKRPPPNLAPEPIPSLKGSGVGEKEEPWMKGVSFD